MQRFGLVRAAASRCGRRFISTDDAMLKKGKAKKHLFEKAMTNAPLKPTSISESDEVEALRLKGEASATPLFFSDAELDAEYGKFQSVMDGDDDSIEESDYAPVRGRIENELIMADKTWPLTSGTDLFMDLIQVPKDGGLNDKERALVNAEAFRRMGYTSVWDVQLPEMSVEIPEDDPDYAAMAIMKQSLMNNGRIKMADKDEIMTMLIDEITRMRNDKTDLIPGLDLDEY
ncbi:Aste57867_18451 [Aphanomyces stellatus]|uniref:Aste57867_18451 protein n=1 Tax=Aphanomyces stellatus TaxID=120398 RepID=A0A485LBR4_9STRA|nr:hypothetical protein As57867_018389 [Aphanomyces stellatus]VFT95187.1 Aste57867_18451 [Aphanomyces stellatus]